MHPEGRASRLRFGERRASLQTSQLISTASLPPFQLNLDGSYMVFIKFDALMETTDMRQTDLLILQTMSFFLYFIIFLIPKVQITFLKNNIVF
jgi:hypothetical protein